MEVSSPSPTAGKERKTAVQRKIKSAQSLASDFDPRQTYAITLIAAISLSLIYALQSFYSNLIGDLSNIIMPGTAFGTFAFSFYCTKRYGFKLLSRRFDLIFFCFSLGMLFNALGETAWAVYYFTGTSVPYPSVADVFYMSAYPAWTLALVIYLKQFSSALKGRRRLIATGGIIGGVSLLYSIILPQELGGNPSFLKFLDDVLYLMCDTALLSITILCLAVFIGGTVAKWWIALGGAYALFVAGDVIFFFQNAQGTYYNGSISDLVYVLAYVVFCAAFYIHAREL